MFYLMPLGHVDMCTSATLLGLVFVLFPLGFCSTGLTTLSTRETDALIRARYVSVWFACAREQLAALKWQIAAVQVPFVAAFYFLVGAHFVVVRRAATGVESTMRQVSMEGRPHSTC